MNTISDEQARMAALALYTAIQREVSLNYAYFLDFCSENGFDVPPLVKTTREKKTGNIQPVSERGDVEDCPSVPKGE